MTSERDDEVRPTPTGGAEATETDGADPEKLKALLDDERQKAQSYMQNWQRAAADYQNFKRRVEEERAETSRFANAALLINLLPILDDLERALQTVDQHLAGLTWVDGIRLILRKFQAVMDLAGVQEIAADGETFDPAWHEAVAQQPGEENKVLSVVQKGYKLGDRVMRPAMVIVGSGDGQRRAEDAQTTSQ
jgi:molecular chaperone GrpE